MADNRCNEMSSSSSPTTSSSSPMNETNSTSNSNESKSLNSNKNSLNAPKYGTPVPNRVFVGGIPTDAKENEVQQLFSRFGSVVSVKIISDRAGVPRGYGFVTFDGEEDANKVIKESESLILRGRKLNVSVAIKKQQHYSNDYNNSRVLTNGSLVYNPYALVNASNPLYPEYSIYSSDGIPFYNMGVNQHMVSNSGLTSPSNPYPYAYHTPGLYISSQASIAPQQVGTPFQTSPQTYPLVSPSFRLPLTPQNVNPNLNQMNPYLHISNTTTPPLSQPSSLPIQNSFMGTVANQVMATDNMTNAINAVNSGISSLSFIQPPVYAISSNIPNSSQAMACVQNVQLKADNGLDVCHENNHLLPAPNQVSQQMVELVSLFPQKMNIQSPNKTGINRNQYSSKLQPNNSSNDSANDRPDRRNANSSSNASHNRKSMNSSVNRSKTNGYYGYPNRNSNLMNANAAENQCQIAQNQTSILNTSALQGMPFVKTYHNNKYHTIPVTQQVLNNCPPAPKLNSTGGQQRITKMVNGVEIYAMPNFAGGDVDCYGYSKTPPLTSGTNRQTGVRNHHK